jgi:Tfp pilus assembly protein PilO
MKRFHDHFGRGTASLGLHGIVGLGLLVFMGAFYFSTLYPEQRRLEELRQEIANGQSERSASTDAKSPKNQTERLAAFYGAFPKPRDLPDLLEKVYAAAARQTLKLEQGEYRVTRDNAGGLNQFQLTLPVRGSYPQIRKFVDAALIDVPTLSLDSIHFERQKVGDASVDAKVKLVVYLGQKP